MLLSRWADAAHAIRSGRVHQECNFVPAQLVTELRGTLRNHAFTSGESFSSDGSRDNLRSALTAKPDVNDDIFYELYERLDDTREELARSLAIELSTGFEATWVIYPNGGYYRRHIDSVSGADQPTAPRAISFIAYLNEASRPWTPSDGGELRCYCNAPSSDADDDEFIDVAPESGSLVLFDSKRVFHEVLPTHRERTCLVGWFRV